MNAWQLAAGLLILAVPFAGGQSRLWEKWGRRSWVAWFVGIGAWLLIIAAGCVLVYGGLRGG